MKRYLQERKELRHSDGGFFISFKASHKAVTSTTTARWVVNISKETGINVCFSCSFIEISSFIKDQWQGFPGFRQHSLEFRRYTTQSLRVVTYIKRYLQKKELRHIDGGFFICFKPSDKAVTSTTIARLVLNITNVSVFSAHSTRSAVSLKASDKGLNLTEIPKTAGWSNAKTLAMLYKKTFNENFGQTIPRA